MLKVHGRCHCGDIRFEAKVDPSRVTICHCTDCQVLTGTGWRASVPAEASAFVLQAGVPREYVKTADSGRKRVHGFCGTCGTPIYSTTPGIPERYGLRVGCLDERAELAPQRQIWCRSALPWSQRVDTLPASSQE
jgi:hypothetical protein